MRIKAAGVSLINRIREYEDTDNWTIPFAFIRSLVYLRIRPRMIHIFASVYFVSSCFRDSSFPPQKRRLSTTRHNYARKKICGSLYPFEGIFLLAINLTEGFFDATISAENSRSIIITTAIERNFSST